jgi:hypothetical protein
VKPQALPLAAVCCHRSDLPHSTVPVRGFIEGLADSVTGSRRLVTRPFEEVVAQVRKDHRESRKRRMIRTTENGRCYGVTGDEPRLIEEHLNRAVELARQRAVEEGRHGVLVTRHGPASFTVAVSADVPYGITREREHP